MFDVVYVAVANNTESPETNKIWIDETEYSCREEAMTAAQAACRAVQKLTNNQLILTYRINFADKEYSDEDNDETAMRTLTAKRKFVKHCIEEGHSFDEACQIANLLFDNGDE